MLYLRRRKLNADWYSYRNLLFLVTIIGIEYKIELLFQANIWVGLSDQLENLLFANEIIFN